jgi:hypothetical protein
MKILKHFKSFSFLNSFKQNENKDYYKDMDLFS